jgi:hypothetical protein
MLEFDLSGEPLQWALQNTKGVITSSSRDGDDLLIHMALRRRLPIIDPISMKLIMEKATGFHYKWRRDYNFNGIYHNVTPTTLALYHPAVFVAWRSILLECGHDLTNFVKQELVNSPLADDGWRVESLLRLFKSDIIAEPEADPSACDRCGSIDYHDMNPHIHLPWRRYLRAVRNGHQGVFDQKREAANITALGYPPYEIVCSNMCFDGFCFGGMYENNLADGEVPYGPDIPAYVSQEEKELLEAKAAAIAMAECPSKKMPGAFVE